jgi:drug/metabolite transporter (DMT)-like permease
MSVTHWAILVALGAAFGSSFAFNEILLATYGPLTVSALRVTLGAVGCWAWVFVTGRRVALGEAGIAGTAIFGVFQYAAPFAVLPIAQEHITSTAAGMANAMTPIAVVVVSHLWAGGEKATAGKLVGVAFGFVGISVIAMQGAESGTSDPAYVLVAIGAPACYAVALNFVRRLRGIDPVVMTAFAMTGGALAILPVALATEGMPAVPNLETAGVLAVVGFGLTSVTFIIMYSILPRVGATNLSLVTFVAPLSAAVIGSAVLGESIAYGHIAGMALILVGLTAIDGRLWRALSPIAARPAL